MAEFLPEEEQEEMPEVEETTATTSTEEMTTETSTDSTTKPPEQNVRYGKIRLQPDDDAADGNGPGDEDEPGGLSYIYRYMIYI